MKTNPEEKPAGNEDITGGTGVNNSINSNRIKYFIGGVVIVVILVILLICLS